jgi:hypothetical protein
MNKQEIQDQVNEIYLSEGGYINLMEAIAMRELIDYKEANDFQGEALDGDITEEIAECIKADILNELNIFEGNI